MVRMAGNPTQHLNHLFLKGFSGCGGVGVYHLVSPPIFFPIIADSSSRIDNYFDLISDPKTTNLVLSSIFFNDPLIFLKSNFQI